MFKFLYLKFRCVLEFLNIKRVNIVFITFMAVRLVYRQSQHYSKNQLWSSRYLFISISKMLGVEVYLTKLIITQS